jgi:hypothetical protein
MRNLTVDRVLAAVGHQLQQRPVPLAA